MKLTETLTPNTKARTIRMNGKRVLFACVPADGHFNPLTGLAVHLQEQGYDVRWYTSKTYSDKLGRLGIRHYPFVKAMEVTGDILEETFPQRNKIKSQVGRLCFDLEHFFILRSVEYLADIQEIHQHFPFDVLVADCTFTAIPFVREKMNKPVVSIGIVPLVETSRDLPPGGLGMTPSTSFLGRLKQHALRWFADRVLFRRPNAVMRGLLKEHGISFEGTNGFDLLVKKATLLLQSGTPAFEYKRSDLGKNVRFIGPLLPYSEPKEQKPWYDKRLHQYNKVVLVTQGTVERETDKIIVPVLEAFKDTDCLVVATTGGNGTQALRARYHQENLIIEDFIPFRDIMPYADVYVTNGGYGGVLLAIENELPLVVAGVHEGKNEINARVGYFKLGINLGTETPTPAQVGKAVRQVLTDGTYKRNILRLSEEFACFQPNLQFEKHIAELTGLRATTRTSGQATPALSLY
ncbi:MAG TPA: nucleotide disphospho-sugar-binding domain-containing protein [Chitinophagaceae bacterium]|jgi:MGT family glycosyltransferase|nr:nucleotide disphospho-sugar-binding domain-containing protein [Chitinophagaceae bacterium]